MKVALDEGPGPPIKYQNAELGKLHQVVSILVRCSDVSSRCQTSNTATNVYPNAYLDPHVPADSLVPLSKEASEYLFGRTSYVKKLIEDSNAHEDGLKLLQYCSWENPHFSRSVLTELLWLCGITCLQDMRHHTALLLNILLIKDSWQNHRIHNALMGVAEERDGLLETIEKVKLHYQKRAYQIIKCLVQLFKESPVAATMLNTNHLIAKQWTAAVQWLQEELERGVSTQYNYSSWSPPGQSFENTTTYMLERSQSAKNTLRLACELVPDEVCEINDQCDFDTVFSHIFFFGQEQEETNDSDVEPLEEVGEPAAAAAAVGIAVADGLSTGSPMLRRPVDIVPLMERLEISNYMLAEDVQEEDDASIVSSHGVVPTASVAPEKSPISSINNVSHPNVTSISQYDIQVTIIQFFILSVSQL